MKNYSKLTQNLENDYEAQLLNDFYEQENENENELKKEKLEKIRDSYKQGRLQFLKNGYINNVSIRDR